MERRKEMHMLHKEINKIAQDNKSMRENMERSTQDIRSILAENQMLREKVSDFPSKVDTLESHCTLFLLHIAHLTVIK